MSQCNKLKLQGIWTNNLQKGKEKQKNLKRQKGNSINQREVTIERKFCSESFVQFCNKLSQPYNSRDTSKPGEIKEWQSHLQVTYGCALECVIKLLEQAIPPPSPRLSQKSGLIFVLLQFSNMTNWICLRVLTIFLAT